METIQAKFTKETTLLIKGVKGKADKIKGIINDDTKIELQKFTHSFKNLEKKINNK